MAYLQYAISQKYGSRAAFFNFAVTMSQFHLWFYSSRYLANMLALIPFTIALSLWIMTERFHVMAFLLVFSTLVLRVELFPISFLLIVSFEAPRSSQGNPRKGDLLVVCSWYINRFNDRHRLYLWQETVWPEFQVFLFNGIQDKSVAWGTSPPSFTFTTFCQRLPLYHYLLLLGAIRLKAIWPLLSLAFVHVAVLSMIKHKEWRFIVYVIPLVEHECIHCFGKCYKKILYFKRNGSINDAFILGCIVWYVVR